jgi:Protein of unknown function (DUF2608)
MLKKEILQILLIFAFLDVNTSFANNPLYECNQSTHIIENSNTITVVRQRVDQFRCKNEAKSICIVYDMDNTLLTNEPNLSSDAWGRWQRSLSESDKDKATHWIPNANPLALEGALRYFATYTPVEPDTVTIVNALQSKYPSMVLTSRSFDGYYSATSRELKSNHLDFSKNPIGYNSFDKKFFALNNSKDAFKMYYDGVYYVANDPKGPNLLKFIAYQRHVTRNPQLCKAIVFIDDNAENIESVGTSIVRDAYIGIHLTKLDAKDPRNWRPELWRLGTPNSPGEALFNLIPLINSVKKNSFEEYQIKS